MYEQSVLVLYTGSLFEPGHTVHRWANDLRLEFSRLVSEEAPLNKRPNKGRAALPVGSLKAGIVSIPPIREGTHRLGMEVRSEAPYTLYVLRGTGTISSRSARIPAGFSGAGQFRQIGPGSGMYLPSNPGYGKAKFVQRVRGQSANNFMQRAADRMAVSHPSLRGMVIA